MRSVTLYSLDKYHKLRPLDRWTSRVQITWTQDEHDWRQYWFASRVQKAAFDSRRTVAMNITETGDVNFYDEIPAD